MSYTCFDIYVDQNLSATPPQPSTPPPLPDDLSLPTNNKTEIISQTHKTPKRKIMVVVITIIFITVIGIISIAVWSGKIKIPNQKFDFFIQTLPLAKKTPEFILSQAIANHEKISQSAFSLSISAESSDFLSRFGVTKLNLISKGDLDYSDQKNEWAINFSLSDIAQIETVKIADNFFFKINALPDVLFKTDTAFKNKWIQANDLFPSLSRFGKTDFYHLFTSNFLKDLASSDISKTRLKMDQINNADTFFYRFDFDPEPKHIDNLFASTGYTNLFSQYFTKPHMQIDIDSKTFIIKRIGLNFVSQQDFYTALDMVGIDKNYLPDQEINFSLDLTLSNFEGKIEAPTDYLTLKQFLENLAKFSQQSDQPQNSILDTKRKTDIEIITKAIQGYYVENGKYPLKLFDLVDKHLPFIPADPENGAPYTYFSNTTQTKFTLMALLSNQNFWTTTQQSPEGEEVVLFPIEDNPLKEIYDRNAKRQKAVDSILEAIIQYQNSQKDQFKKLFLPRVRLPQIPQTEKDYNTKLNTFLNQQSKSLIAKNTLDICKSLVPQFITSLPTDPKLSAPEITDCTSNYSTGYIAFIDDNPPNYFVVAAPNAENNALIWAVRRQ